MKVQSRSLRLVVALILVFVLILTASCKAATPTPRPTPTPTPIATPTPTPTPRKAAGKLVIATETFDVETWLPSAAGGNVASAFMLANEYLLYRKSNRELVPGLAERWEVSPDAKTYTFYLRKGVQWHDGWGEFTAEDVKWTYEESIKEGSKHGSAARLRGFLQNIEIKDPYTIVFHLQKPSWDFLYDLSNVQPRLAIFSKKYVESVGLDRASRSPAIGTGPYRLVDYKTGEYMKFEALDTHWRVVPHFKEVEFRVVPSEPTRVAMFLAGQIDIATVSDASMAELLNKGYRRIEGKMAANYYIGLGGLDLPTRTGFDPKVPWVGNPNDPESLKKALKVRMALNLAVDKNKIIEVLFKGAAVPGAVTEFVPGSPESDPGWTPYPYDPVKAKQLLVEAGYPDGFTTNMYLFPTTGRADLPDVGEAVAGYWEKIGIKVNRRMMDWAAFAPIVRERKAAGITYPFAFALYDESVIAMSVHSSSKASYNMFVEDPQVDKLIEQALAEMEPGKRMAVARSLGQYLYDNYFSVPIAVKSIPFAVSNKVNEWPRVEGYTVVANMIEYITSR